MAEYYSSTSSSTSSYSSSYSSFELKDPLYHKFEEGDLVYIKNEFICSDDITNQVKEDYFKYWKRLKGSKAIIYKKYYHYCLLYIKDNIDDMAWGYEILSKEPEINDFFDEDDFKIDYE